ncbi:MAG TPA: hypothetical protein VM888_05425 [Chitinophagaceae bacterium]|jgi:hypothetical protein|nr:hypothetical protein [Chitinophagaceae bacterium]
MKRFNYLGILLLVMMVSFSSCEAIGDIFGAGMKVGIFIVLAIVVLVLWLVFRGRR